MPSSAARGNGGYNPDMSDDIVVTDGVRVPGRAVTVRAVRASGPGGQNVNKVATKIDLRVDLDAVEGLSEAARARLRALVGHRLDAAGRLVVTSQATRNQARNLEAARGKVVDLVRAALVRPRSRVATRPSAASEERRIAAKKRRGAVKDRRARPDPFE
jgi:ribosome-associated protein